MARAVALAAIAAATAMPEPSPAQQRESKAPPIRIVSLKPSITDTLYALGAGRAIVGVTKECDIPAGFARPAIAGDYTRAYAERIAAISPDIVLGSEENSSKGSIEQLQRLGLDVRLFPFTTVAESLESIRAIGRAIGMRAEGEGLAASISERLEALRRRWGGGRPIRVVVIWGVRPIVAAGPGTYMDELLPYIGAENAIGGTKIKYPRLGLEDLARLDPDAIVDLSDMERREGDAAAPKPWDRLASMRAVKEGRVIVMDPDDFRAGPRLPDGLAKLAAALHSPSHGH